MPTNQLPAKGNKNWAEPLNKWLAQTSPESLGGIHNGDTASRPAGLTADDEGRIYVDTESQELIRWNGSAWQILLTGNQESKFNIQSKTTDYTITSAEAETGLNGFSNDGATGAVVFTLPDAVAGMKVTVINAEDQTLQVQSVNDDKIYTTGITSGTGLLITTTKASSAEFYCINGTEWMTKSSNSIEWKLPFINTPTLQSLVISDYTHINLSWTDNSDNETNFRIYRSTDGASFAELTTVSANTTTYKDTTTSANTQYWYKVAGYNTLIESDYSNTKNIVTSFDNTTDPGNFSANPADYAGNIQVGWKIGGGWVVQTNGTSGLIMARWDESTNYKWSNIRPSPIGATSMSDGESNTNMINSQNTLPSSNIYYPAACVCYNKGLYGYNDWYLPAIDQLRSIKTFVNDDIATYGFSGAMYWSSTEISYESAYNEQIDFGNYFMQYDKDFYKSVRAVRSF